MGMGMGAPGMMPGPGQPPGMGAPVPAAPAPTPTIYYLTNFTVVVHSALAILLGLAGGVTAQVCHAKRESSVNAEKRDQ
jgi:hypothetical protein